jgi:hypothetical protein
VQGYNAQAVCTANQIVIAAEVTNDSPDFGHLGPMIAATEVELAAAGVTEAPAIVLADAGYWHQAQMEQLTGRGTVVLIPPDAGKREARGPAGTAVCTRLCDACWRPTGAASSTPNARA